jgi:hypothetical protein
MQLPSLILNIYIYQYTPIESTYQGVCNSFSDQTDLVPECLKHIIGEDLHLGLTSANQAKVIKDEYAADIIAYYASKGRQTAQFSLRKFQTIGIRSWIREVTGAANSSDLVAVTNTLNQVMDLLTTMNCRLINLEEKTAGYQKASIELPGLKEWMEKYAVESSEHLLLDDPEVFTLREYLLQEKRLTFDKPAMSKFSQKVAYVFRTMSETSPARKRDVAINGYRTPAKNAYRRRDFPLLDLAFKQTVLEI